MPTSSKYRGVVRFDGFEFDLSSGQLRRDGISLKLQPQPAKVLVELVSRAGEVVSRKELADQVWGAETFVDFEQGLNFAIRQIRTALGDDADQPRFLETLPKRGYRFIRPVEEAAPQNEPLPEKPASSRVRWALALAVVALLGATAYLWLKRAPAAVPPHTTVLGVLPFDDLSPAPEQYLADGLTEELIAQLTRINPGRLKVIARTSAMQYVHTSKSVREIGQELGADYLVESSIRREGGRLRITAQLVRATDQTHLWAQNYERETVQLLPLESEVAQDIAEQIHVQLLSPVAASRAPDAHSVNPEAHQLYLQGRFYFNQRSREGLQKSVDSFSHAIAVDPSYAAAYAGLADSYNLIAFYGFDPSMSAVTQAKIAADKALQLDDSLAAAHAALAYTEFVWREDWPSAEREFRRAIELDDNYVPAHQWYALYLAAAGHMDESLRQMRYAQTLDPLSPTIHAALGYMYYFARDYDHAVEQARIALQLNSNLMMAHAVLGWTYTEQRKYPDAIAELENASRLSGGVPVYECALGRAHALSGNLPEARKILAREEAVTSEPRGSGSAIAALRIAMGDPDRGLHWLEETAPGDVQANWLRVDPAFDSVRQNPRFVTLLNRMGTKKD